MCRDEVIGKKRQGISPLPALVRAVSAAEKPGQGMVYTVIEGLQLSLQGGGGREEEGKRGGGGREERGRRKGGEGEEEGRRGGGGWE